MFDWSKIMFFAWIFTRKYKILPKLVKNLIRKRAFDDRIIPEANIRYKGIVY